jgi:cellulose synthase/poly-beta-1,6-N-acetylglucosamine synthase-like glycosyltransferase
MISFIIPAHNEEALLGRTLSALSPSARALGEPYEVIVANDASTDRTGDIALEHGARVVAVNRRQIAATRNAGARAALGDFFIFVDADTTVTKRAVWSAVRALRGGAVGGGCAVRFDGPVPMYAAILERLLPPFLHALGMAPGCFLFCTRQAYLAAGGFDEALYVTEEVAFGRRLKRQGRFVMLREFVFTSGRKMRTHTALELLRIGVRLALGGPQALRRRDGLDYWYGQRSAPA